ncbi:MAG TPA: sigma-70 family RNA polymerase sigma factor [Sandaracinaceae bacterium LLY-WYZ-13_1]|nr:sigma-70 family RNA polymerase sigma factor [Sandaracinaceae bacterium LLY-WYZ-13_1]
MQTKTDQLSSVGRYIRSLGERPPLDPDVERELARRWAAGDDVAGQRLIEASLPFVIRVAKGYRRWGIPLEDLIQQGNLGLLKAAKKFDPDKDCRLITYANYWIRAEIRDYVVRTYRIVRLGSTATERRAIRAFRRQGIEGPEELAERSGMPLKRAKKLWPLLTATEVPLDASRPDGTPVVERMQSTVDNPEDTVVRQTRLSRVREMLPSLLDGLTVRERRIVEARMLSEDPITLRELGKELGVCRERVRQLEAQARDKLRVALADYAPAAA